MAASVNPYGRISEADQLSLLARAKTRKRITIIAISSILLVGIIVAAVVVGVSNNQKSTPPPNGVSSSSIKAMCGATLYPDSCFNTLSPLIKSGNITPQDIYKLSVQVAINELSTASEHLFASSNIKTNDPMDIKAIESCKELVSLALDHLNATLSIDDKTLLDSFDDLKTWLSAAGTYQDTCIYGFNKTSVALRNTVFQNLKNSTEYTSNSLAIISSIEETVTSLGFLGRRRLMSSSENYDESPYWLTSKDRKLLQAASPTTNTVDFVVAKDGSGKFKTIGDALKAVPDKSKKRFVIYVKKGVYFEKVRVEKSKWNVMMFGDGMDATIVSGSLNVVDGTPTFDTASFAVLGKGFIARDMGFQNTAGAAKHQAVALMSTADFSVFYRCRIDAYQDSLYTNANRQFYRDCEIRGTVDFIFGNSAVVFQNSIILVKKPNSGQKNVITAQGKSDPNQNTGISIQNCTIRALENLNGVKTYLGRPWKDFSTTIFMQSNLANIIDPSGWLPWVVGTTPPDTISYAEYQNVGAGAVTKSRVQWKGLKVNINSQQAIKFTVKQFINGDQWLPTTGANFKLGL